MLSESQWLIGCSFPRFGEHNASNQPTIKDVGHNVKELFLAFTWSFFYLVVVVVVIFILSGDQPLKSCLITKRGGHFLHTLPKPNLKEKHVRIHLIYKLIWYIHFFFSKKRWNIFCPLFNDIIILQSEFISWYAHLFCICYNNQIHRDYI